MKISKNEALKALNLIKDTDAYKILLEYIDPFRNVKSVDSIKRLYKACSPKEKIREFYRYLYFDGTYLAGTNGEVLHLLKNSEVTEIGYYNEQLEKVKVGEYTKYPSIEKMLYIYNFKYYKTIKLEDLIRINNYFLFPTGHKINMTYLKNAINGNKEFTYYYMLEENVIKIIDGDFEALIMGIDQLNV